MKYIVMLTLFAAACTGASSDPVSSSSPDDTTPQGTTPKKKPGKGASSTSGGSDGDATTGSANGDATTTDGGTGGSTTGVATTGSGATSTSAGAGGGGDATSRYESGSRLRISYLKGADGSKSFTGFYDSQLQLPCSFAKDQDGKTRCQPGFSVEADVGYYDANCTQAFIHYVEPWTSTCGVTTPGRPEANVVRTVTEESITNGTCTSTTYATHLYLVTSPTPVAKPSVAYNRNGVGYSCQLDTYWPEGPRVVPARELLPSEFVEMTPTID